MPLALHELALAGAIFILAGAVKGIAGFGFPAVSIGLLVLFRPLPEGMALILAPTLLTNLWQALSGPHLKPLLRRLWGLFLGSTLGAAGGAASAVLDGAGPCIAQPDASAANRAAAASVCG